MADYIRYILFDMDGNVDVQLEQGTVYTTHGLKFTGARRHAYGEHRANNLLHMVEHFASEEDPSNPGHPLQSVISDPLIGQLWYDKTLGTTRLWNGTTWITFNQDVYMSTASVNCTTHQITFENNAGDDFVVSDVGCATELTAHVNDTSAAHTSTNVVFDDSAVSYTATNLQSGIALIDTALTAHLNDTVDAHDASAISYNAYGSITSANVQAALEELDDEITVVEGSITTASNTLTNHINDTVDAHDASAISFNNSATGFASNNVQGAIEELEEATTGVSKVVVDSMRAYCSSAYNIPSGTWVKIPFNAVDIGDDYGQFSSSLNRYTALFPQYVRVTLSARSTLQDEAAMHVAIRKNGVMQRQMNVWNFAENANLEEDCEVTGLVYLATGQYIEGWIINYDINSALSTNRLFTFMSVDIIDYTGTLPPVPVVRLENHAISATGIDLGGGAGSATASISFYRNGNVTTAASTTAVSSTTSTTPAVGPNEWYVGNPIGGIGDGFQVRAILSGGTSPSSGPALSTWHDIDETITWENSVTAIFTTLSKSTTLTISIRDKATNTIQDTCTIDLDVFFNSGGGGIIP